MNFNFLKKNKDFSLSDNNVKSQIPLNEASKSRTLNFSKRKIRGFTLVEMLVSVAIFSIVLVAVLSSILVVMDANRKARTLSSVMNNLNFALESMTRSIKTGEMSGPDDNGEDEIQITDQYGDIVRYYLSENRIYRNVNSSGGVPVTAKEVSIESLRFQKFNTTQSQNQPRVSIIINGVSSIGNKISSDFILQATVSQRNLNL